MTTNGIQVIGASDWDVMQQQAKTLVESGFLPQSIRTAQQAIAIIMLGKELGIAPWAALTSINVIQGKPTVSPQLMLALINRSGQLDDIQIVEAAEEVRVMMRRHGRSEHWEKFGKLEAQAMQLWSKDNWKKQPATMMKWRAVAACARVVFADVILGLYTPEEMGADVVTDAEGNMTVINEPAPVVVRREDVPVTVPNASASKDASADPLAWVDEAAPGAKVTVLPTLDMKALYNRVMKAKIGVKNWAHFENLYELLADTRVITLQSSEDDMFDAMKAHEAQKEAVS